MEDVGNIVYESPSRVQRWQGDVYPHGSFGPTKLPAGPPYWMVMNRTCHMIENTGRPLKLDHLVYCAVFPLEQTFAQGPGAPSLKNQITNLVKSRTEYLGFLPESETFSVPYPLAVNFNLVFTVPINVCPPASSKLLQLASPFCEQLMQRFSRWFYTVGIDDEAMRSKEYINALVSRYGGG